MSGQRAGRRSPEGLRQAETEKISDIKSLIDLKILKNI